MFYLELYIGVSTPFMVSVFIQYYIAVIKGKILPLTLNGRDGTELKEVLEEVRSLSQQSPKFVSTNIMSFLLTLFAIIQGLLWVVTPFHSVRGILELSSWEFKEV